MINILSQDEWHPLFDNIFSTVASDAIIIGYGDFSQVDSSFDRYNMLANVGLI